MSDLHPLEVTIETTIGGEHAEDFYRLYLDAFEPLRTVDGHTFARHQLGQRVGLALDTISPFAIDIDQTPSFVDATETVAFRQQPALRRLVEDHEVLGGRDPDHHLAQLAPLVVGAEAHARHGRRCLRSG